MDEVQAYPDVDRLMHAAAEQFVALAARAIEAHGRFSVALSGGSTPKALHRLLASAPFAGRVDWARVHVFWGDERCVPPDHEWSNWRMARETLLDHVPIPAANAHRIRGEIQPAEGADEYEQTLRAFFGEAPTAPRFGLVLLGMGDDGHTASLFPGTDAVHEPARWVVPVECLPRLDPKAPRVTLTPVAINAAANVTFLVAGANKAARLKQVLEGPYQPDALPAQSVRPADGRLVWMMDAAAAGKL